HLVVVGAGFVGAEVAAGARTVGMDVTLVEAAPTPLTRVVDPRVGEILTDLHRENGVDVRVGVSVTGYEGSDRVERVRLSDGSAVEASMVVAGIGVHLNTEWLRGSGVKLLDDGAVACDEYSATSLPNVYAVGDLANWPHPRYGGRIRLEHWTNAGEQGEIAARNLLAWASGQERTPFTPVPYFWSDQYKMKVQLLGQGAPADEVRSEEHTSELQSRFDLVCRLLLVCLSILQPVPYTTLFRSYGGRIRLEHWTNAGEQGEIAARNLLAWASGQERTPFTPVPYFWSDQYKMKVQLLGQGAPADEVTFVHGTPEDRKFVAFFGRDGMLTGVLGLRSTPRTMRYRGLLEKPTSWEEALAAAGAVPAR